MRIAQILLSGIGALMLLGCTDDGVDPENASVSAVGSEPVAAVENNLLEEYCTDCHNLIDYSGGIDLEGIGPHNIDEFPDIGEKVIRRLRAGMMPPVGEARPDFVTMQAFAGMLESNIDANSEVQPGRPGLHRLNRSEYQNVIRDLLGLEINAADYFPADDSSRGFDNQAGALTLSPALLEAYLSAASKISRMALGTATEPTQRLYRVEEDANQNFRIDGLPFGTRGGLKFNHHFPVDGEYKFRIFAITLGNMGNDRPFGGIDGEQLQVLVDGELVKVFDWDEEFGRNRNFFEEPEEEEADPGAQGEALPTLDVTIPVAAGNHEIGVTFVATNFAPGLDMNNDFERSTIETGGIPGFTFYPHVGSVRVDGPYNVSGVSQTASRKQIFNCYPESADQEAACAENVLSRLADLGYRGKSTEDDVQTLMSFYATGREGGNFDTGIEMALQRLLADPKFIYRIEQEPGDLAVGEAYPVDDLDLASRLSFFLWSSIPDQELLELAKAGRLSDPEVLDQQVRRLLNDPKSEALTRNFAGQWLALRNLDSHVPVVDQFPDFDNLLRESFRRETELLFDSLIRENRPITDLLTADYTFVNERLAMHYGIPGVRGERFRRVELEGDLAIRAGILGNGSTLTVASQPGRTSPVMRGYWVLANLIGVEPPPPPPDVPALEATDEDNAGNTRVPTLREQMEAHRDNPGCMGCHQLMDPIGFALESFDAVGRYREVDASNNPIDPTDVLYDGTPLDGAGDLKDFLLTYQESVTRNITQRMLTYALGRGMETEDMPLVRQVQHQAAADDYRFQGLISAVVTSEAFLMNEKVGDGETESGLITSTEGGH